MKPYAVLMLILLLAASVLLLGAQNGDDGSSRLVGTWVVNVTANPVSICGGPQIAPAPPPFVELATYAAGGTFTETNSELNFNSVGSVLRVNGSDGHGAWQSEDGKFKTSFRKLLFDSTGAYIGNADLHEQVTVAKSTGLSGAFTITVTFFNAGPPLCSSGTLSGQRMTAN
jgi:hypothetical protein